MFLSTEDTSELGGRDRPEHEERHVRAEEDTQVEEDGHEGTDTRGVLGVDGGGTVDHGDGSRETVHGREAEDDDEGGSVGLDVGIAEGNDEEHDEGEVDGLNHGEDPVPTAGDENDDIAIRSDLGDEARQGTTDKVTDLESSDENDTEPAVLEGLGLRQDVEEKTGEDGEADKEDPEDIRGL